MDDSAIDNHINGLFQGIEIGAKQGESIGCMKIGEHAWHIVEVAIEALETGKELRALMLLRTLKFALAAATGYETPLFYSEGQTYNPKID